MAMAPISFVHHTKDGPFHLLVKVEKQGCVALYWGREVAGAWPCATVAEANETVLRCFHNIVFAHQCTKACGPVKGMAVHKSNDLWGMIREA